MLPGPEGSRSHNWWQLLHSILITAFLVQQKNMLTHFTGFSCSLGSFSYKDSRLNHPTFKTCIWSKFCYFETVYSSVMSHVLCMQHTRVNAQKWVLHLEDGFCLTWTLKDFWKYSLHWGNHLRTGKNRLPVGTPSVCCPGGILVVLHCLKWVQSFLRVLLGTSLKAVLTKERHESIFQMTSSH